MFDDDHFRFLLLRGTYIIINTGRIEQQYIIILE